MKRIRLTASEEMSFENVDRRRTDDGRTDGWTTDTFILNIYPHVFGANPRKFGDAKIYHFTVYYKLTNEPSAQVT